MKKLYLYTVLLICLSINIYGQSFSGNETYTYTRVFLDSITVNNMNSGQSVQNVTYTDGLGRVKQSVSIKAVKSGQDLVTSYFYEAGGRQTKQYMPVSVNGQNGLLHSVSEAGINSYHGVSNAYSEVMYDDSPLNRVVKSASPGDDWSMGSGHTKDLTYGFNVANTVKKYTATLNTSTFQNSFNDNGYYAVNTLYKISVKDEDGNVTEEYKNGNGQVLMTRVKNGGINLDTYYVYNQFNQLVYVIPPLNSGENPVNAATRNKIAYQYNYDAMGRLLEKKLPGKEKEFFVYDKEDRVIMSTDTKMKSEGKWSFVKYDKLGRVVYTGLCSGGERNTEQAGANASGDVFEERSLTGFNNSFHQVYYTKNAYPTVITDVLSINYYDEYPPGMPARPAQIYSQPTLSSDITGSNHSTKSLLTASYVRNVENVHWNKTLFWYDTKERLVGSHKVNHLNGYSKTEMKLDFPGNITESKVLHKRTATGTEVEVRQRYVYSAQNLLIKHYHKVDNQPEELLTELTYDDLGRVTNKKVGNNLQSIDYAYNIRGWLTSVNDLANLGTDIFAYKINYNQREGVTTPNNNYPTLKVQPRYNGSIAETSWATTTGYTERYGYVYDGAGRLRAGLYQPNANPYEKSHSEIVTYDNRGNIKTMYRTSYKHPQETAPRLIDNLSYTYDGNQVTHINDLSGNENGYEGGNATIQYDVNGNMTAMPDKGIINITYNFLNLPSSLTTGSSTAFLYSADGTKLRKTLTISHEGAYVDIITEYLDGFQYSTPNTELINGLLREPGNPETESLKTASEPEAYFMEERGIGNPGTGGPDMELMFFPTSEGFYDYENKRYIYQYKDHLGNVRISYTKNTATGTAKALDNNKYYAFGMNHLSLLDVSHYDPLSVPYNYKYNGKELQETGMYDYGWRHYMPDIGRWNGMDQLSEMYAPVSPYAYVANNPVNFTDPDGRKIEPIWKDGKIVGYEFTEADAVAAGGYLKAGGDWGELYSQVDGYGGDFGSGPLSNFWNTFHSNGVIMKIRSSYTKGTGRTLSDGTVLLAESVLSYKRMSFDEWLKGINVEEGSDYSGFDFASDIAGGLGLMVDGSAYIWDNLSNKKQWRYSYKAHKYLKGKGYNFKTSAIKNSVPKGFKATGVRLGIASGLITVGDALYNSEINASHILDASVTAASFIPGFGWAIGGSYFLADMIHRGIYDGQSIGDRLDEAVGGPLYDW